MAPMIYGFLKGKDGLFHYTLVVETNSPDGRAAEHLTSQRTLIRVHRGRNKILSRCHVDPSNHAVYAFQTTWADRHAVTKWICDTFKALRPKFTLTKRQRRRVGMFQTR